MKRILLSILSILFISLSFSQICPPDIFAPNDTIRCNEPTMIIIGDVGGGEDFSCGGPCLVDWEDGGGAQFDDPYIPSPDGNTYMWMGPNTNQPRSLTSPNFNATCGGSVCFDFVYPPQLSSAPTEGPDLSEEGITFQYSIDNGISWIDIAYFMPNGQQLVSNPGAAFPMTTPPFNSANTPYTVWNSICLPIPLGGQTVATKFRWSQEFGSSDNFDHWGIDNVYISITSSPMNVFMTSPNSYPIGVSPDTIIVTPLQDTEYQFVIIDGANLYYDTVHIYVEPTDAGPPMQVSCSTIGVELGVTGVMPYSNVVWTPSDSLSDPNIQNPYANPVIDQMYTVTSDCGVDSVLVNVVPIFIPNITSPNDSICVNDAATLIAGSNQPLATYTYDWTNYVQDDSSQTTTVSPSINTMYYLEMVSDSGCIRNDSINIYVGAVPKTILYTGEQRVCRGDSTEIVVTAIQPTFFDDFDNNGPNFGIWTDIQSGDANTDCGVYSGSDALHFNGNSPDRWAQLQSVDASLGGNLSFWLIYGSGVGPCGFVGFGSDVLLEYSTDNAVTWTNITIYNGAYANYTLIEESIPVGAQTPNTIFRIRQMNPGGIDQDNWAIDDFLLELNCVIPNCVTYSYNWTPSATVTDPTSTTTSFFPSVTTSYSLQISPDGYNCVTAADILTIEVDELPININPSDTYLCEPASVLIEADIPATCNYSIDMEDSFGDGWNGNTINVFANGVPIGSYTVLSVFMGGNGNTAIANFSVPSGQVITFEYVTGGWQNEVSFDIYDYNGSVIFTETTGFPNISNGVFFTLTSDCINGVSWSPNYMITNINVPNPIVSPLVSTDYVVTVLNNNNCVFKDTAHIEIYESNTNIAPSTAMCIGETVQLYASGADTYTWTPASTLNNANIANPISNTTSDLMYYVTFDTQGCIETDSVFVNVMDLPNLDINNGLAVEFCEGESIDVFVDDLTGWSYTWTPNSENTALISVNTTGNYSVTYNDGNCVNTSNVTVSENAKPVFDFSGINTILCCSDDSETVLFSDVVSNINIQSVYWNGVLTSDNSVTFVSQEDNYVESNIFKIISDKGCESDYVNFPDFITKCINPSFTSPDTIFINTTSNEFVLTTEDVESDLTTYLWATNQPGTVIVDETVENPIFAGNTEGIYNVNVVVTNNYDGKLCEETAESKDYEVLEIPDPQYPDAFTPNGDDINNIYRPIIADFAEIIEFRIYDRWGNQVYDMATADNKNGWDGKINGVDQNADMYIYFITVKQPGKTYVREGNVTLLR